MAKASDNLFPKLLLVEGAAPTSPAAGNQGLFIDSADHKLKRVNSAGAVTTIEGGSGSGSSGLLASATYNPGTLASYSTTSTSSADIDATNLAVTFTAPASGQVRVRLEAVAGCTGTGTDNVTWVLRSGTTDVASAFAYSGGTGGGNNSIVRTFLVTGLTAGQSYTYKWGWKVNSTTNTGRHYAGGTVGVAYMDVSAA